MLFSIAVIFSFIFSFICALFVNLCKELNIKYLVRGLRNTNDYIYEENIAKINNELNPELKTIYFRATNEIISSSFVRELLKHKEDISKYVPTAIYELIKGSD